MCTSILMHPLITYAICVRLVADYIGVHAIHHVRTLWHMIMTAFVCSPNVLKFIALLFFSSCTNILMHPLVTHVIIVRHVAGCIRVHAIYHVGAFWHIVTTACFVSNVFNCFIMLQ